MGEIIHVQVGGCGNRIGYKFYETITREHSLLPSGERNENNMTDQDDDDEHYFTNIYFQEERNNRWSPRAVLVDFDKDTVHQVYEQEYGAMFKRENGIYHVQSAGGNWAIGHYTLGAEIIDDVMDVLRKQAENCDQLLGFQLMHSLGGGAGSGLGTLVLSKIREEFPAEIISTTSVFPSPKMSSSVVEPYNCVLALHQLIENTDFVSCFDNNALLDIQSKLNLPTPDLNDMNRLIANIMSDVTCSFRLPTHLGYNMRKLVTNLVPFPRLHFAMISHVSDGSNQSVSEIFQQLMDPKNAMCRCDVGLGRYIAAVSLFRGAMPLKEVTESVLSTSNKKSSDWVEWIPNNLKPNICAQKSGETPSATLIGNSTAIQQMLNVAENQFNNLYKKRAFLWGLAGEGMDEMEFTEAQHNLKDVIAEYMQYETFEGRNPINKQNMMTTFNNHDLTSEA